MAQNYKLVLRYSVPGDKTSVKKYYAMAVGNGYTSLDYLCNMIASRSTFSTADVKSVLDSFNYVLNSELREGRIVQMGELGSYRIVIGSDGVVNKADFNPSMIRWAKLLFTPGKILQKMRHTLDFHKVASTTPVQDEAEAVKAQSLYDEQVALENQVQLSDQEEQ